MLIMIRTLLDLFRNKTNFVPEIQDNKLQFMGSIDGPDKGPSTIQDSPREIVKHI